MNNEHVFFLFSLCDSVVQLSIVYKKTLSHLPLFLSLRHARANERDSHSKRVISQARRASPRVRYDLARSFLFPFFLSASLSAFRGKPCKLFLLSSRWDFYFVSWFSFLVLSIEAIYYFKGHCFYDIDRLFCKKKRNSDFCYLSLSLSLSLFVRSLTHSLARSLVFAHR
jgi:hypothetical protein